MEELLFSLYPICPPPSQNISITIFPWDCGGGRIRYSFNTEQVLKEKEVKKMETKEIGECYFRVMKPFPSPPPHPLCLNIDIMINKGCLWIAGWRFCGKRVVVGVHSNLHSSIQGKKTTSSALQKFNLSFCCHPNQPTLTPRSYSEAPVSSRNQVTCSISTFWWWPCSVTHFGHNFRAF